MQIRILKMDDIEFLVRIHQKIWPDERMTTAVFQQNLRHYEHTFVGEINGKIIGYTAVSPIPGLPRIRNLQGFISPERQRQGLGSQLLQALIQNCTNVQLSYCVADEETAVYPFLLSHNFYLEHSERHLALQLPNYPITQPPNHPISTFPRQQAIDHFLHLYSASFGPHPWYQPYAREEVATLLLAPQNLLFLLQDGKPIGFAWAQMISSGVGEIEPIGILPAWQGKGNGRILLNVTIHKLQQQGAERIQIGAWERNASALQLYESVGFEFDHKLIYLAYDL